MPDYQHIDYRLRCHTKRTDLPADVLRDIGEAYAEIKRLSEEQDDTHALIETTGAILAATSDALHGGALPNGDLHSWHDLPELVEKLRKERDEARREICMIMGGKGGRSSHISPDAIDYAKSRGWDCFKEDSNEPWSAEKHDAIARHIKDTVNEITENTRKAVPQKIDLFKENTNAR